MKVTKAVIFANDLSVDFLPITKAQPKEMLPLVDRPLIQYAVEEAIICGAELVVIVKTPGKTAIEDHFDRNIELETLLEQKEEHDLLEEIRKLSNMVDICYVRHEACLGPGHALLTVKHVVGEEPFMLILPSDLFDRKNLVLRQILEIHERYCSSVVAIRRVSDFDICRRNIVNPRKVEEDIYELKEIIKKPSKNKAPSNLAIIGRYVLMPEIFEALETMIHGHGQDIQLEDALSLLLDRQAIYGYTFDGNYYDISTPIGWIKANITLALNHEEMGAAVREHICNLYIMPEVHMSMKSVGQP